MMCILLMVIWLNSEHNDTGGNSNNWYTCGSVMIYNIWLYKIKVSSTKLVVEVTRFMNQFKWL